MLITIITIINWTILWYLILLSFGYIILLIVSIPDILFHFKESELSKALSLTDSKLLPPVTVIISSYNEADSILETLYSLFKSNYPNLFIILIDDGSTDNTLSKLIETFKLHKVGPIIPPLIKTKGKVKNCYLSEFQINMLVVAKENSGKSDSINIGVNLCRTPLFITYDADGLIEPDAIYNIVFSMLTKPYTIAIGGAVYILNGCSHKNGEIIEAKLSHNPLYALQAIEYLRSFLFSRSGWNFLGGALCYAGAFTLFDHKEVLRIKGFDRDNVAQDFEIITHLHANRREHNADYNISYTPAAAVWTDVPGNLKDFWIQRTNWQIGTLKSLFKYKKMLFNPKYGVIGLYTYPFFLFGETLGPVVEFIAYLSVLLTWYAGILDLQWAILFFIVCWGLVTLITMVTAFISFITFNKYLRLRDMFWMLFWVSIESFGFRQFHVICKVVATMRYFFTKKSSKNIS